VAARLATDRERCTRSAPCLIRPESLRFVCQPYSSLDFASNGWPARRVLANGKSPAWACSSIVDSAASVPSKFEFDSQFDRNRYFRAIFRKKMPDRDAAVFPVLNVGSRRSGVRVNNGIPTDHHNLTACLFDYHNARAHHHDCPLSHHSGRADRLPR